MDRSVWDPIRVCGMSDPDYTTTCCGKTRANANCKNRISRQSRTDAAHLLQLLALRQPADDSLVETLHKIARLLLCKRNHQHKEDEQVQPLAMRWYESARASRAVGEHGRDSPTENRQIDSPLYPELDLVDVNSTSLTPMDVEPAAAECQSIRIEQLRQRSVPFEVSPSSPARIQFGTANADNTSTPVILRSLRQDDDGGSSIECLICHDDAADDIANLQCERCRRSVHLGCMRDWLERRSTRINFNCSQCRGVTRFDASYSAAETTGEAGDGVESAGGGRTARGEITSEGDTVLRRSRRRTGRPDYYVP
ncbi:hypothetical protein BJX68DRAFT_274812 [Aspergillus pseudodeflectus]|uniref:RING-type domain-containing protein n=1 Tax=Aspergillus pseudodeflectus TaxID=176178 RepID=A0ABR4J7E3_9EURO